MSTASVACAELKCEWVFALKGGKLPLGSKAKPVSGKNQDIARRLTEGEMVQTRLSGNSMTPIVKSRQLVTIEPCKLKDLAKGDVTFCKVRGNYYLHLVKKVGDDGRVLIGNNHGHDNGWTRTVFGKLAKVEP